MSERFLLPMLLISCIFLLSLPLQIRGATYTVGDSDGWKLNVNYTTWVAKQKYYPGDYLVFNYPQGEDTVYEVKKAGYDKCDTSNPINFHNDGKSVLRITRPGVHYYISGTDDHCAKGQKFSLVVISLSGPSPATSPAVAAPPQPTSASATSPPSEKRTAAPNGSSGGRSLVFLPLLLLLSVLTFL